MWYSMKIITIINGYVINRSKVIDGLRLGKDCKVTCYVFFTICSYVYVIVEFVETSRYPKFFLNCYDVLVAVIAVLSTQISYLKIIRVVLQISMCCILNNYMMQDDVPDDFIRYLSN